ncbi:tetratricopeptide repeat protein [Bacteroidales bacterium AH-315-I05]|nr:tetratricopeptide repeat protein [Bacteroidales bacterium AH-315-I05]
MLLAFVGNAKDQDAINVSAEAQVKVDSLKLVIATAKHDTSICNAYLSWGEEVYLNNPDTALILFHVAREIAEENLDNDPVDLLKRKYLFFLAEAFNNIGTIHHAQGNFHRALDNFHKSLNLHKDSGSKEGVATSLNNIGAIYKIQGDIQKALEYFHKSLKTREETGDKLGVANSLNNIGIIYQHEGDIEQALRYFDKSLKIREEIGDKTGVANSLNNIGVICKIQGDIQGALDYSHKSLKISEEIGDKLGVSLSLNNIGTIYHAQGDNQRALKYFHNSLKIGEAMNDKIGVSNSLDNIAIVELLYGQMEAAGEHAQRSLSLAREVGSPYRMMHAALTLKEIAEKKGNYKGALEMHTLHVQMRDSIKSVETQKAMIRQQTKYEFEKKMLVIRAEQEKSEQEIELLERDKRIDTFKRYVLIGALFFLLLVGGLVYRQQRMRVEKNKALADLEKKQLKEQLDFKNKELMNFASHIIQKDNYLKEINTHIQKMLDDYEGSKALEKAKKLSVWMKSKINLEQDLKEFQTDVELVQHDFMIKLKNHFPDLTNHELNLASLLKLNLSTKEISTLINIAPTSVEKARYRLRKKMNISTDQTLADFFHSV